MSWMGRGGWRPTNSPQNKPIAIIPGDGMGDAEALRGVRQWSGLPK